MALPVFPPSITTATQPKGALLLGYQETSDPNVVESEMQAGPKKRRKLFENQVRVVTGKLILDATQRADLKDFYSENTAGRWTWTDPDDGTTEVVCRFRSAPTYDRFLPDRWYATLAIEILPEVVPA